LPLPPLSLEALKVTCKIRVMLFLCLGALTYELFCALNCLCPVIYAGNRVSALWLEIFILVQPVRARV
jgi:hypothetical protein